MSETDRIPPYDTDAEKAVLGIMLDHPDTVGEIGDILDADDFYVTKHRTIYNTIRECAAEGAVDTIIVTDALVRAQGQERRHEISMYMLDLLDAFVAKSGATRHAEIVRNHARLRQMIAAGHEVQEIAYTMPKDVQDAVVRGEMILFDAAADNRRQGATLIGSDAGEYLEELEARQLDHSLIGIPTGFRDIDDATGGWQGGQYIVVGARPSMGKTALMTQFGVTAAFLGKRAIIFSLEMGRRELQTRIMSQLSGVSMTKFNRGSFEVDDWARVSTQAGRFAKLPIVIDDDAMLDPMQIGIQVRRLSAQLGGVDLVILDYMQLLTPVEKSDNRQVDVSEMSRHIKVLARQLNVPFIVGSQLNRGVEMRTDKHPLLSDLRESGSLEQDSDIVLLLYRDEVYNKNTAVPGLAEIKMAKQRNGPTGHFTVRWKGPTAEFVDPKSDVGGIVVPPIPGGRRAT